jgi:dolichol-phosphate mannosyltransferase
VSRGGLRGFRPPRPFVVPRSRSWLDWLWLVARASAAGAAGVRLARAARRRPSVAPALAPLDLTISVVVPARNEAARLGRCLGALAGDPAVAEVIVVDDESTDGTAGVARRHGARVVAGKPLPAGWAGKAWALQQGLESASGEWVVTLDADAEPAPGLCAALVQRCLTDGWDLLTVAPRFRTPSPGVQWLHPALLTTLVYRYGPPGALPDPLPHRQLANGQCQVFRRFALLGVGGFGLVRGSLVEDVALARTLAIQHWRVGFLDASSSLLVQGYDTFGEAWKGWGRSLPLSEVTPWWETAADLAVVWLAQAGPLLRVLAGRGDLLDVALLALRAGTLAGTAQAYDDPRAAYWLSPLADPLAAARLTQATVRPERRWRGRSYQAG